MYTTLQLLKANDACKNGYRQMVSFFGMSAKMKERKIPLSLCALVLSEDNMEWLMTNSIVIDPEAYQKFYERWALKLNLATLWGSSIPAKGTPSFSALMEFVKADSLEAFNALLQKYKFQTFSGFDRHHEAHWNDTYHHRHTTFCRQNDLPPVDGRYFGDLKHLAFLFSDDPYGEAMAFIAENQNHMPLSKARLKLDMSGENPRATFDVSGAETVYNAYRFLSNKNTSVALARELNGEQSDEEGEDEYGEDRQAA